MTAPAKLTFSISGMACPDCITAIENAVLPLPGVSYVGVSLSNATMTVRPAPGLDIPALTATVAALGYSLSDAADGRFPAATGCRCLTGRGRQC